MSPVSTVMHVEDDEDIQEITKMALEMIGGLAVIQFLSGADAVANAESCRPDVLLLDVMMPGMDGEQTLAALRAFPHLKDIPAIFMSAQTSGSSERLLETTDAVGYITKPFDPITLADKLLELAGKTA